MQPSAVAHIEFLNMDINICNMDINSVHKDINIFNMDINIVHMDENIVNFVKNVFDMFFYGTPFNKDIYKLVKLIGNTDIFVMDINIVNGYKITVYPRTRELSGECRVAAC